MRPFLFLPAFCHLDIQGATGQSGGEPTGGAEPGGSTGGGTDPGGGTGGGIDLEPLLLRAFANALEGFRSLVNFLRSL